MPNYDYYCRQCEQVNPHVVPYTNRREKRLCPDCSSPMAYLFPMNAIMGYQPFEAYYDEALDGDITSRRDKKDFLLYQGLVEAGDKVHGGRNFDKHAPHHIKPLPPRGTSVWENADRESRIREMNSKPENNHEPD